MRCRHGHCSHRFLFFFLACCSLLQQSECVQQPRQQLLQKKQPQRSGGINVANHSKRNRKFRGRLYLQTPSPDKAAFTTIGTKESTDRISRVEEGEEIEDDFFDESIFRRRRPFRGGRGQARDRDSESGVRRESDSDSDSGVSAVSVTGTELNKSDLKVGIVLPKQIFQQRKYQAFVAKSLTGLLGHPIQDESYSRGRSGGEESNSNSPMAKIRNTYNFQWNPAKFNLHDSDDSIVFSMLAVSPPPSDITNILCEHLANGSAAIIYFTNTEKFGKTTAASQYFLLMAGFLGIPVIAWNADNTGLEKSSVSGRGSEVSSHLQLAPSLHHQVTAMLSILDRYNWQQFCIVTSEIAGHDDFVQAVRDNISQAKEGGGKYVVQNVFKISAASSWSVSGIADSECRILLLYCTQSEASLLMEKAARAGLTSTNYLWLVTQSVVGNMKDKISNRRTLPVGMIGINFEIDLDTVLPKFLSLSLKVFFDGVHSILSNPSTDKTGNMEHGNQKSYTNLSYNLNCQGINSRHRWETGLDFYKHLRNLTMENKEWKKVGRAPLFNFDGTIAHTEMKIVNFKPNSQSDTSGQWDEVGTWTTWSGLDIKDIVWPGGSHVPPEGVPEKFHVKITFLEEPPFIIISDPDPISSKCSINRGVPCRILRQIDESRNVRMRQGNETLPDAHFPDNGEDVDVHEVKCCSGLCIDLLIKFEDDLDFTYDLVRSPDPKWGTIERGKWNGLMNELVEKKTDMVLSSLKISATREAAVDFTVPFLQSGIAIVVAKRTGIISATAFLEPFDSSSWMLVALVAIQASAFSIFLFEWLSPSGYNMQITSSKSDHRFSLFRTYWLVWAVLFQASVQVDCPRGLTARFMSGIWALFAVVFLALYTANLAAFMIPRKEYHNFSGIDDQRMSNPLSQKPGLRFCTVPYSYTAVTLKKNYPEMHSYMQKFSHHDTTKEAIRAVKNGTLDAFIYDGMVLSYLASQDEECRLLQVGSWSAMTGYALAFPQHSKYKAMFNEKILELRENGDLERLERFWMNGMCKPNEQEKKASEPLSIAQFQSAFMLLFIGTLGACFLLALEHCYTRYKKANQSLDHEELSPSLTKNEGCWSLISLSIGQLSYYTTPSSMADTPRAQKEEEEKEQDKINSEYRRQHGHGKVYNSFEDLENQGNSISDSTNHHSGCQKQITLIREELSLAQTQIAVLERQLQECANRKTRPLNTPEKETVL